jgi:hypothetical protein
VKAKTNAIIRLKILLVFMVSSGTKVELTAFCINLLT